MQAPMFSRRARRRSADTLRGGDYQELLDKIRALPPERRSEDSMQMIGKRYAKC
ncbi:MAG: hypothetical protein AB9866_14395 [Syntrophobacteraceae bacterium]